MTTFPSTPAAASPAVRASTVNAPWRTELLPLESVRVPVSVIPLAESRPVRFTPLPVVVTPETSIVPKVEVTAEEPETESPPKDTPRRITPAVPVKVLLTVIPAELVTKAVVNVDAFK